MSKTEFSKKREDIAVLEKLNVLNNKTYENPATQNKKKERNFLENKLSFEEEADLEEIQPFTKKKKSMKNPSVNTAFLKKTDEEAREEADKLIQKKKQVLEQEERTRSEEMQFEFKFVLRASGPLVTSQPTFNRTAKVKKGSSVEQFLKVERQALMKDTNESVSQNLIFIAAEFIVPDHLKFFELMQFKYTNGVPIFIFSKDQKDPKEGKELPIVPITVMERSWYEKNRHIYPQSRWEVFDDLKAYSDPRFSSREKNTGSEEVMTAFLKRGVR